MERDVYYELGTLRALAEIGLRELEQMVEPDQTDWRQEWNIDSAKHSIAFIRSRLEELDQPKEVDNA